MKLGVNIDHIATLRNARGMNNPSLLRALKICENSKIDTLTIHLREDRRHINDLDAKLICSIKNLFLPYYGLTSVAVRDAPLDGASIR